jgi:hypothetical protein
MRALKGAIPRAFTSHKSPDGYAYRRYVFAIRARLFGNESQQLPADVLVTLREAGRLALEEHLERLAEAIRPRSFADAARRAAGRAS